MPVGRLWLLLVLLAAIAILVPYFALRRESRTLDASIRETLGGSYLKLPGGITHYELSGPDNGPVVVLVHGGTIPFYAWDPQMKSLHDAGFRVLRYDHFGRGYSDRPAVDYDRALYRQQLEDLLAALRLEDPVSLVGVSFGGAIVGSFAAAHPERVAKIALIAPVVDYAEGKALFGLAKVPGLGQWYARVFSVRATVARASGFFEQSGADPSYAKRFDEQTRFAGYEHALLSMARTNALSSYRETYAAIGEQPALLLWGSEDAEIPREHMDFLRKTLPKLSFIEIEGAGHGVTIQREEEVNRRLAAFLN